MPLRKGAPVGETIREFHAGKTYARTKAKVGKKRADAQAIAVSIKNSTDEDDNPFVPARRKPRRRST